MQLSRFLCMTFVSFGNQKCFDASVILIMAGSFLCSAVITVIRRLVGKQIFSPKNTNPYHVDNCFFSHRLYSSKMSYCPDIREYFAVLVHSLFPLRVVAYLHFGLSPTMFSRSHLFGSIACTFEAWLILMNCAHFTPMQFGTIDSSIGISSSVVSLTGCILNGPFGNTRSG